MLQLALFHTVSAPLDGEASIHPGAFLLWVGLGLVGLLAGIIAVRLSRRRLMAEVFVASAVTAAKPEPISTTRQPVAA